MHMLQKFSLFVLTGALFCGTVALAQSNPANVRRIVDKIDESQLTTLHGNTHPAATAKNDLGRVSADLPMTDLMLVLSRSAEQQAAFEKFVADQYDPNSAVFHQWLTPEQVGAQFGPSSADIATVSNWLVGRGFTVNEVTKDHMSIRFSGTASLVEGAFHTEIHNLQVNGVAHIGNMSDPQIPTALTPVVAGIKSLHNFFPRPAHHMGRQVTQNSATGKWMRNPSAGVTGSTVRVLGSATTQSNSAAGSLSARPQFGISVGGTSPYQVEDVDPWDFATIYNILPLWNASSPINGAGQTIAIAGTSDINQSDVATFRRFFGLPAYSSTNQPTIIHPLASGDDPGICTSTSTTATCTIDDLEENSLDVEWSGAIAPLAHIVLVNGTPQSSIDDNLFDAEQYVVNNVNTLNARILNVSYGECELANGTAGNVEYYNLWQTAAAEGIAVFVAAGDSGSASCDDGRSSSAGLPYPAEYGANVSGLASTPFNTAVGGTDFNWCSLTSTTECTPAPYWGSNTTSTGSSEAVTSALGYVPEVPWNDTCTNPLALGYLEYFFNTSPALTYTGSDNRTHSVTDTESGCNDIAYNSRLLSNSGDSFMLDFVDTVGGSGGASGCVVNSTNPTGTTLGSCATGTTSVATTLGTTQLTNDGWQKPSWQTGVSGIPADGVRDLPDVSFFASDGFLSSSAYLICVSEASVDPQCTYSTNQEPFAQEVGGTSVATPAMAGVMALINQRTGAAQGNPNAELYKLAANQPVSACSAETVKANSSVCYFNDIDTGTIAMPCDYSAYTTTPSPNCALVNSWDFIGIATGYSAGVGYDLATGLGSLNISNVVNAWPMSTTGSAASTVTVTPAQSALSSVSALAVIVTLASTTSGGVTPTGTVTLTASGSSYSQSVNSTANSYSFTIPANSLPGTPTGMQDTLTATYSGDSVYAANTGTATVTVTAPTFTLAATTPANIAAGAAATSTVTVATTTGYVGTVTLTCSFTSTTAASGGDGAACALTSPTVSSATLTSSATSGTVGFTVSTTAPVKAALVYPKLNEKRGGWLGAGGGAVLACLLFLGIPARRRSWRAMLGSLLVMVVLGAFGGCGGGGGSSSGGGTSDPGTLAGTYTFTVQATGNPAVNPAVSTTFTVTVN